MGRADIFTYSLLALALNDDVLRRAPLKLRFRKDARTGKDKGKVKVNNADVPVTIGINFDDDEEEEEEEEGGAGMREQSSGGRASHERDEDDDDDALFEKSDDDDEDEVNEANGNY